MKVEQFKKKFEHVFTRSKMERPQKLYKFNLVRKLFDPCPTVKGMASIKKLQLLNIAYSFIQNDECYLEVGTYNGKSLIAAMLKNTLHETYACDNFSQFNDTSSQEILFDNLARYGLKDKVTFFNDDFKKILDGRFIKKPIGLYLYDGAHNLESQYQGIKIAEPLLSNSALIIVDDWRYADDSHSFAKEGTMKAIAESRHRYELLYELPARFNGDQAMWWNGVGVIAFQRKE